MRASNVYLYFNGHCRDAMTFYRSVFGAGGDFTTFADMPPEARPDGVADDGVMHCELHVPGLVLMAGDYPGPAPCGVGENFAISLACESARDMDRAFAGLSDGGSVATPSHDAFWGDRTGLLVDRFGVRRMLSFRGPE
jgi:PhnB protein